VEKKKTIEELIKERKEREKNNTPEARAKREAEEAAKRLADFKKNVAIDAQKLLKAEEARQKKEEKEKEEARVKGFLDAIKNALKAVRKLSTDEEADPSGDLMKAAKLEVASALTAATKAGIDQEDIAAAAEDIEESEPESESESKPKKRSKKERKKVAKAAAAAAWQAKEEGKSKPEIAKAASQAAKAAEGDPLDIKMAAAMGLKIAAGEVEKEPPKAEGEESSSSSSSSESSGEEEEDLGDMDRHQAKMDGMAAVYYFGMGR